MKKESETQFLDTVIGLISSIKRPNETFDTNLMGYDLFTETGLAELDVLPNSFLGIKLLLDNNFETFRKIYLQYVSFLKSNDSNIVLICNLTSDLVDKFIKKLDANTRFKVISIDDLNNVEFDLSSKERDLQSSRIFPRFDKAISFERFTDFLLSLIRVNVLIYALPKGRVNMTRIISQKDDIFPFAFLDENEKWHIFIREKSKYTRRSILFQDNAEVHRAEFNSSGEELKLRIDGNEYDFQKITKALFGYHIAFFNSYSSDMIPESLQYKYRKFGNSSFDEFDEKDIGEFVKAVIEKKEIYFSTKEQLNDPFDLDTEVFGPKALLTASNYRIFCTADKNNNILMWSHYGDSHFGYCTSYKPIDILTAIEKSTDVDFCVYGGVNYQNKRKASSKDILDLTNFLDNETATLVLQILQLFKKYKDWSYEGEFRYIISLNEQKNSAKSSVVSKTTGLALVVNPIDYYFGHNFDFNTKTKPYLLKYIGKKCYSFDLSKKEYELLIKTIDLSR